MRPPGPKKGSFICQVANGFEAYGQCVDDLAAWCISEKLNLNLNRNVTKAKSLQRCWQTLCDGTEAQLCFVTVLTVKMLKCGCSSGTLFTMFTISVCQHVSILTDADQHRASKLNNILSMRGFSDLACLLLARRNLKIESCFAKLSGTRNCSCDVTLWLANKLQSLACLATLQPLVTSSGPGSANEYVYWVHLSGKIIEGWPSILWSVPSTTITCHF